MPGLHRSWFGLHRSAWPLLLALLVSIPAFYDSLMPSPTPWVAVLYVLSGALVLGSTWWISRSERLAKINPQGQHGRTRGRAQQNADWVLGVALLLCAVMPPSNHSMTALSVRMVIALSTLLRLVLVSKPLFERAGLARLMGMGTAILGLCGLCFYWIDPDIDSFGEGLWLAFSTAATVGYGDVVPSTTASRIFSVFVVLLGYGLLSLVTASIAAMFVGSQERKIEQEILHDMHNQLAAVREDIRALRGQLSSIALAEQASAGMTEHPELNVDANAKSRHHVKV